MINLLCKYFSINLLQAALKLCSVYVEFERETDLKDTKMEQMQQCHWPPCRWLLLLLNMKKEKKNNRKANESTGNEKGVNKLLLMGLPIMKISAYML